MHSFTVLAIASITSLGFAALMRRRSWKVQEAEINDIFSRKLRDYDAGFGQTESGRQFLDRPGRQLNARLSPSGDPSLGLATGIWTKVLGGSITTSLLGGLVTGAVLALNRALGTAGANKGKTEVQIQKEQAMAIVLESYLEAKKSAENAQSYCIILALLIAAAYTVWTIVG